MHINQGLIYEASTLKNIKNSSKCLNLDIYYVYFFIHEVNGPSKQNIGKFYEIFCHEGRKENLYHHIFIVLCKILKFCCLCTMYVCLAVCVYVSVQFKKARTPMSVTVLGVLTSFVNKLCLLTVLIPTTGIKT